jgi:sarcosine oxidase delta subunit
MALPGIWTKDEDRDGFNFKCPFCGSRFKQEAHLNQHVLRSHEPEAAEPVVFSDEEWAELDRKARKVMGGSEETRLLAA